MHRLFLLTILALSSFVPASYGMAQQRQFVLTEQDKTYLQYSAIKKDRAHIFAALFQIYKDEKKLSKEYLEKIADEAIVASCAQQLKLIQPEINENYLKRVFRNAIRNKDTKIVTFMLEHGFFDAKKESCSRQDITAQEAAFIDRYLFGNNRLGDCLNGKFLENEPGRLFHELFYGYADESWDVPVQSWNVLVDKLSEIVSILKMYGADINSQDHNGNTALLYWILRATPYRSISYNNMAAIMHVFLEHGANPDICNKMGDSPFIQILDKSDITPYRPLVRKCIDLGASTDILDDLSCKYGIQVFDTNTKEHIEKHWLAKNSAKAAEIAAETMGELTKSNADEYAQGIIYEYLVGEQKKDKPEQEK